MSTRRGEASGIIDSQRMLAGLTVLAFLSPGAWLVVDLPPQPIAQFLHVTTVGLLLAWAAWRLRDSGGMSRWLWGGIAAVAASTVVSLLANVHPLQQLVYDLYGEMPALMWLAYVAAFGVAAGVTFEHGVRTSLVAVVWVAVGMAVVMFAWRFFAGFVTTFGSPAYSVPAFAPVPFLALGLAATSREYGKRYLGAVAVVVAALVYATAGLSALYVLAVGLLAALTLAPELVRVPQRLARVARVAGGLALAAIMVVMLFIQVPMLGSGSLDLVSATGGEQTVATRVYLWEGAQQMSAERLAVGYGPSGYRFSAVEFYDPGVFEYISAIGSDPIAYSAPSPHSLLWEVVTRLGLLGVAALALLGYAWVRQLRARLAEDAHDVRRLRLGMAIGFIAYVAALLVTPVHFASGLLGAVVAGYAIAPSSRGAAEQSRRPKVVGVLLAALAVMFVAYGGWRMVGLQTGAIDPQASFEENSARIDAAARVVPGEPMNERRLLEIGLWTAATPLDLDAARQRIDAAPGYVTGFAPNLVQFAYIGMTRGEQLGVADFGWEADLLARTAEEVPFLPSLAAEQLHLALLEGDAEALPDAIERAERYGATYPMTAQYVARARELSTP